MTLPSVEPLQPEEPAPLPPARRRHQRRVILPPGEDARAGFLYDLSRRMVPSFDFFLFTLLSGLVLGLGLLLDSPALFFLAALLAPFMAPVMGMALGTITGALRYWLQSLTSLLIGSLIVFLCGVLAGGIALLLPERAYQQAALYSSFTWGGFVVLALGAGFTAFLVVRSPQQRPLVTSVALAYSLYLPIGAAGFGLISGMAEAWPGGLAVFVIHLLWATLIGAVVLAVLGLRPLNGFGYLLGAVYLVTGITTIVFAQIVAPPPAMIAAAGVSQPTQTVSPTPAPGENTPQPAQNLAPVPAETFTVSPEAPTVTTSPSATPTRTLVPSNTPTETITPASTPVWGRIRSKEGNGIWVRAEPSFDSEIVQSLLNGSLVEILPDVIFAEGVTWVKVRTPTEKEGWAVRSLLVTATPAP